MPEETNNPNKEDQGADPALPEEGEGNQPNPPEEGEGEGTVQEAIEGGAGAGESQGKGVSLKDELGKALGKDFPDDATALKAVKDTFSHVGDIKNLNELKAVMGQLQTVFGTDQKGVLSKIDEIAKTGGTGKIDPAKFVSKEKFDRSNFYLNNPDYKPYRKMVETYQKAHPDMTREEIVESDDFKEDFEKIKAHDEAKDSKSILKSNPRLGKASDKMSEAKEAQGKGDQATAEQKAVESVVEAYPVEPKR